MSSNCVKSGCSLLVNQFLPVLLVASVPATVVSGALGAIIKLTIECILVVKLCTIMKAKVSHKWAASESTA